VRSLAPLLTADGLVSLVSLTVMELVLGIDNILLVAILSERVQVNRRKLVRRLGIGLALVLRVGLLLTLSWIMSLTRPLFHILGDPMSARDLVLLVGGLFLMYKATRELFERVEQVAGRESGGIAGQLDAGAGAQRGFASTLAQILALDVVFSLDSVITAVGMARAVVVMIAAMLLAVGVMLIFANIVSDFINRHPSMRVLALSFLLLVGVLLVADAFGHHINRGYVYFAMGFSLAVELINMRKRKQRQI
jgi:predicted tellurium resistance membrane protein TerC